MSDAAAALLETDAGAAPVGGGAGGRRTGRELEILDHLAEAGLKIALAIERQVTEAPPGQPLSELNGAAMAFARVSRAVRQTLMLRARLRDEANARTAKAGDLRSRTLRIVREVVEDEHGEKERAEGLLAEAAEGLEHERWGDILTRPVGEVVADICRDLDLSPDWASLDGDIAAAEAFAHGVTGASAGLQGPIEVRWLDDDDDDEPPVRDTG